MIGFPFVMIALIFLWASFWKFKSGMLVEDLTGTNLVFTLGTFCF